MIALKRILSILLILSLSIGCLAGCSQEKPVDKPISNPTEAPIENPIEKPEENPSELPSEKPSTDVVEPIAPIKDADKVGFTQFDSQLINHINNHKSNENYMVSPLSLKMALLLATTGANGETLDEMLTVLGYDTLDDYLKWGTFMLELEKEFDKMVEYEKQNPYNTDYDADFLIANGIWHNTDKPGQFLQSYKDNLEQLNAIFNTTPSNELKTKINEFVNEKTNGMIPEAVDDSVIEHTNVLVNTLYLKSYWASAFEEFLTKEGEFTTITGEKVNKELMNQSAHFDYYEDKYSQVLIMPMDGDINVAFVIGDNSNILKKIDKATDKFVNVTIPKFDFESEFKEELMQFLQESGMKKVFSNESDLSNMMDVPSFISGILQKTKIELNEAGLKAAAVTIIYTDGITALPPKPVDFTADKPFTFYIYSTSEAIEAPELLFFGQYVK